RLSLRPHELGVLLELFQRGVPAIRRYVIDPPLDACLLKPLDLGRAAALTAVGGDGNRPPSGLLGQPVELGYAAQVVAAVGHPAVCVAHDTLQRVGAVAGEEDWRGRLLGPPPPRHDPVRVDPPAPGLL